MVLRSKRIFDVVASAAALLLLWPLLALVALCIRACLGRPILSRAILHFVGGAAAGTFGPLMRFVAGTGYSSRSLTRGILDLPAPERAANDQDADRWRASSPGCEEASA
jgi:hypothetical protein